MVQKKHCVKAELQINADNEEIMSCVVEKGRMHDITLFKNHEIEIAQEVEILADSGYQGLQKQHTVCRIPVKKSKLKKVSAEQKQKNRQLSQECIKIEHINRRCKNFGIVKDVYRGKRKHCQNIWQIICGVVNLTNPKLRIVQNI